jgi:hypothetical protein
VEKCHFYCAKFATDEGDRHFELVGKCYVDGKMHGEFIQDQASKGLNAGYLVLV